MKDTARPWLDHATLTDLLATWRTRWIGRGLFRVAAGPDWIRLHLEGEAREAVLLTCLPGAAAVMTHQGRLPEPLHRELIITRQHPLGPLLAGAQLVDCGMLPEDRVACFAWRNPRGQDLYLLHQLFGPRGNTALIDSRGKLLWAWRRPPHTLLTTPPSAATWVTVSDGGADESVSERALDHLAAVLFRVGVRDASTRLGRHLRTAERLVANLSKDLDNAVQGDLFRRRAEALATNLHTLAQGASAAEVIDPRTGKAMVIGLDPALTPAANMELWFRRARKAEKGRDVIAGRLETALGQKAVWSAALSALQELESVTTDDAIANLAALQGWQDHHGDLVPEKASAHRRKPYGPEEPGRPFRRFLIDGRWEVWIGRNNKENDELTHRAAHSRDIWMHAQGVPGSHVILRTGGKPEDIPKAILAKAAALAGMNSKARHAGLVPVIYTEKRYVRKPRKALPGTAVCLREKSLFVEPGLPPGAESI